MVDEVVLMGFTAHQLLDLDTMIRTRNMTIEGFMQYVRDLETDAAVYKDYHAGERHGT